MDHLQVYAPAQGRGEVQTGPGDVLKISRSHNVVVGRDNHVDLRYKYTIERVTVSAAACQAIQEAYEIFGATRDRTKAVTSREYRHFRDLLDRRLEACRPAREPRREVVDEAVPEFDRIQIEDSAGVTVGDGNNVTSVTHATAVQADVDLFALVFEDAQLARDLFDALAPDADADPQPQVIDSVHAALDRLGAEEMVAFTGVGGTLGPGGVCQTVIGAGAVTLGTNNCVARSYGSATVGGVEAAEAFTTVASVREVGPGDVRRLMAAVDGTAKQLSDRGSWTSSLSKRSAKRSTRHWLSWPARSTCRRTRSQPGTVGRSRAGTRSNWRSSARNWSMSVARHCNDCRRMPFPYRPRPVRSC